MADRIPTSVRKEDLLEALKPFFDLLHTDGNEMGAFVVIASDEILFTAFTHRKGDDPKVGVTLADPPQQYAELAYPCRVAIV